MHHSAHAIQRRTLVWLLIILRLGLYSYPPNSHYSLLKTLSIGKEGWAANWRCQLPIIGPICWASCWMEYQAWQENDRNNCSALYCCCTDICRFGSKSMTSSVYAYVTSSLLGLLLLTIFLDNIRPTSAPPAERNENYSYWQVSSRLSQFTEIDQAAVTSASFLYKRIVLFFSVLSLIHTAQPDAIKQFCLVGFGI